MNLIIIGPPGSGKGVQSSLISKYFKIAHISPGEILREEFEKKTKLGIEAEKYWRNGNLVPDEMILKIVKKRLKQKDCKKGFILDGFPRTLNEAQKFLRFSKLNNVVLLDIPDKISIRRITGRRECSKCDAIYGPEIPSKKKRICDKCSGKLYQREDDSPNVVKNRLKIYHKSINPIINLFKNKRLLAKIEGSGSIQDVFNKVKEKLTT